MNFWIGLAILTVVIGGFPFLCFWAYRNIPARQPTMWDII